MEARARHVFAGSPMLRGDPIGHRGQRIPVLTASVGSNDVGLDLNQDREKFWSSNERGESKWDLDSHNTQYGIFSATPKKRAN